MSSRPATGADEGFARGAGVSVDLGREAGATGAGKVGWVDGAVGGTVGAGIGGGVGEAANTGAGIGGASGGTTISGFGSTTGLRTNGSAHVGQGNRLAGSFGRILNGLAAVWTFGF